MTEEQAAQDARLSALLDTWHDVQPAQDTEAATAVVAIRYSPYHAAVLGYLRAAINAPERCQRVLDLTTEVGGYGNTLLTHLR